MSLAYWVSLGNAGGLGEEELEMQSEVGLLDVLHCYKVKFSYLFS